MVARRFLPPPFQLTLVLFMGLVCLAALWGCGSRDRNNHAPRKAGVADGTTTLYTVDDEEDDSDEVVPVTDKDTGKIVAAPASSTGALVKILNDNNKTAKVSYLVPSNRKIFKKLVAAVDENVDQPLTESIQKVSLFDKAQKPYEPAPAAAPASDDESAPRPESAPKKESAPQVELPAEIHVHAKGSDKDSPQQELIFKPELKPVVDEETQKTIFRAENVASVTDAKTKDKYEADVTCRTENCDVVEMQLKRVTPGGAQGQPTLKTVQAGIFYMRFTKKIRVTERSPDEPVYKSAILNQIEKKLSGAHARVNTISMVNGGSYADIHNEVFDLHLRLVNTDKNTPVIEDEHLRIKSSERVKVALLGINVKTGNLAIAMTAVDTDETVAIYFETPTASAPPPRRVAPPTRPKPTIPVAPTLPTPPPARPVTPVPPATPSTPMTPQPTPQPTPPAPPPEAPPPPAPATGAPPELPVLRPVIVPPLRPTDTVPSPDGTLAIFKVNMNLPLTAQVNKAFAAYKNNSEVKRMVRVFKNELKNSTTCTGNREYNSQHIEKFASYAPNVAPYMESVVENMDVTPEIGYLLLLESQYLLDGREGKYFSQAVSEANAVGPWQILYSTGKDIRNRLGATVEVYPVSGGRPDPRDDRVYFMNATYMAATYLKSLFNMFPYDPGLAILSYRWGQGRIQNVQGNVDLQRKEKLLERYRKMKITLADILEYNIKKKAIPCEPLNYAFAFLAARTIGQNLDQYGFGYVKPYAGHEFQSYLKKPNGHLPGGL